MNKHKKVFNIVPLSEYVWYSTKIHIQKIQNTYNEKDFHYKYWMKCYSKLSKKFSSRIDLQHHYRPNVAGLGNLQIIYFYRFIKFFLVGKPRQKGTKFHLARSFHPDTSPTAVERFLFAYFISITVCWVPIFLSKAIIVIWSRLLCFFNQDKFCGTRDLLSILWVYRQSARFFYVI